MIQTEDRQQLARALQDPELESIPPIFFTTHEETVRSALEQFQEQQAALVQVLSGFAPDKEGDEVAHWLSRCEGALDKAMILAGLVPEAHEAAAALYDALLFIRSLLEADQAHNARPFGAMVVGLVPEAATASLVELPGFISETLNNLRDGMEFPDQTGDLQGIAQQAVAFLQ